jgi:WhiB family redox-sensing transcriptional regulator
MTSNNKIFSNMPDFTGAFCADLQGEDKDIFTPDNDDPDVKLKTAAAQAICHSGCPLINECFDWAMSHNEVGIWAGTTDRQRRALRREQRLGVPIALPLPATRPEKRTKR